MSLIEVKNITKKYGKKQVLNDITFSAEEGECIGIVGANGCGKSTLLKILQGGHKPTSGALKFEDNNPLSDSKFFSKYVGYVPQENPLFSNLTVYDNLRLWYCDSSRNLKEDIDHGLISDFGITTYIKEKVRNLSGGMKKRLSIVCALAKNPKILILDEPGASLDIVAKNDINNYMKKYVEAGGTILIASHEEGELSICTKLYLMKNGVLSPIDGGLSVLMERMTTD